MSPVTVRIQSGDDTLEVEVAQGSTLLDAIRAAALPFSAPCGGKASCGKCEVLVLDDTGTHMVLACQTEAAADTEILLSDATAAVEIELIAAQAASSESRYGVAIDLGTTTLAACLVEFEHGTIVARAGRMNPQLLFGADVITRIEAAAAGKLELMRTLINDALYDLIARLCAAAALPLSSIESITLAGNTVMEHIASGTSPVSIGVAPYKPVSYFGEDVALWSDLPPVWFAPCVSGYVGGDVVAGMLCERELPFLLIDLGTNGELALQTRQGSVCAATAAGPVFEGMNIRWGMPALPGAIRSAFYDEVAEVLTVDVIGGGKITGICGSGLIDLVAIMLSHDLIDESGRVLEAAECNSPLRSSLISLDGSTAFKPLADYPIVITQQDVRNLQLAKAAVAAGIEIVLDTAGLSRAKLAGVAIAGSFGLHLDQDNAAMLGLIPASLLAKTSSIGNSSLDGARAALLNPAVRKHMAELARSAHYVELSSDARFSNNFVEHMGFDCF
jgi:uncharacterized 2Fe-2S/4Fe-4S cluster protein (DUF4445 family)